MGFALSPPVFQSYAQDILKDAAWTANVAEMTGYSVTSLAYKRPDDRVRWSTGTVTVTATRPGSVPAEGAILVIPMSNLVTSHVTLTNNSGLSVAIPFPTYATGEIPDTCVVDLTLLAGLTARTAHTWNLVISGNTSNVTLGAAVLIYGPRQAFLDRGFEWPYKIEIEAGSFGVENEAKVIYRQGTDTLRRSIELTAICTKRDADLLEGMFKQNFGDSRPGFLWHDVDVQDGFFGYLQKTFSRTIELRDKTHDYNSFERVQVLMTEMTKGEPLL